MEEFFLDGNNLPVLSISQLRDHGCKAYFTKDTVSIQSSDNMIIVGHRSSTTKLWHITLPTPATATRHYINNAFQQIGINPLYT